MLKPNRLILALASALALTGTTTVRAWDFSYGYQTIFAPNANQYLVGQQNVSKITEWQSPPVTYWGSTTFGIEGRLTSRFTFSAPTARVFLKADIVSFNWAGGVGSGYGYSSLWGSKDGTTWELLLDNPTPPNGTYGREFTYNQDVPSSLLGGDSFWLQVRLNSFGDSGLVRNGQFSRSTTAAPGNIFELDAMLVPEPSALSLGLCGALAMLGARTRRNRG